MQQHVSPTSMSFTAMDPRVLALSELEWRVHSLRHMTDIASTLSERLLDWDRAEKKGDTHVFQLTDAETEDALFAIYHAAELARDLREAYLKALSGE